MICKRCDGRGFYYRYSPLSPSQVTSFVQARILEAPMLERVSCAECNGRGSVSEKGDKLARVPDELHFFSISTLIDTFPERIRRIIRTAEVLFLEDCIFVLVKNKLMTWDDVERALTHVGDDYFLSRELNLTLFAAAKEATSVGIEKAKRRLEANGLIRSSWTSFDPRVMRAIRWDVA